jgi:hypothetical protein
MLPNFGSGPEIQGDAVALVQNISTAARAIATEATGPGAATAKAFTTCHLWMGLPCDRLNGLL